MALSVSTLTAALTALSDKAPTTIVEASQRWSDAYTSYVASATALDAMPIVLPTAKSTLQGAMNSAMSAGTFLDALPSMLGAFWLAPPIAFAGPFSTGIATPNVAGLGTSAALQGYKLKNLQVRSSSDNRMSDLAKILHGFTQSIAVTTTNTSSGVISTVFLA